MFEQTVSPKMLLLMQKLSYFNEVVDRFYLAGGTALALQYGHRKSVDLDFFTQVNFDVEKLVKIMLSLGGAVLTEEQETLHAIVDDIKTSFFFGVVA